MVRWTDDNITQQGTVAGLPTISSQTWSVRKDERVLADSKMVDITPLGLRLRRALTVLSKHGVLLVRDINRCLADLAIRSVLSGWHYISLLRQDDK